MKYIKTFESNSEDIKFTVKEDVGRYRIEMFVGDVWVGYSIVMFKSDVFSTWRLCDEEVYKSIPDAKCLYIFGISVGSGKGWGSKLTNYIEEFAKQHNCEYVTLGSITKSLGFWKKMGYELYSIGEYYSMYKKV